MKKKDSIYLHSRPPTTRYLHSESQAIAVIGLLQLRAKKSLGKFLKLELFTH